MTGGNGTEGWQKTRQDWTRVGQSQTIATPAVLFGPAESSSGGDSPGELSHRAGISTTELIDLD